jgi:hypothetical protein
VNMPPEDGDEEVMNVDYDSDNDPDFDPGR